MKNCKECGCFPVCDECTFRGFNADECEHFVPPYVHAYWIIDKGGDWAECSHCHESEKIAVMEHKDFCGACGARMDGDR